MGSIILLVCIVGFIFYSFYLHIDEYVENVKDLFNSIIAYFLDKKYVSNLDNAFKDESEKFRKNQKEIDDMLRKLNINKNIYGLYKKPFKKYRK